MTAEAQVASGDPSHADAPARPDPKRLLESLQPQLESGLKLLAAGSGLFGIFLAVVYFMRIRYFPIENMASLATLSGAIALVAVLLFGALLIMWSTPTIFVMIVRWADRYEDWFDFFVRHDGKEGVRGWRLLALITPVTAVIWFQLFESSILTDLIPAPFSSILVFAIWTLAATQVYRYAATPRGVQSDAGPLPLPGRWWTLWRFAGIVFYGMLSVIPLEAFLLTIQTSSLRNETNPWILAAIILGALAVMIVVNCATIVIAMSRKLDGARMAGIQAAVLASILAYGVVMVGSLGGLQDAVMSTVSVRLNRVNISLDKTACDSLSEIGIALLRGRSGCVLTDVTVASRTGDRWRVYCEAGAAGAREANGPSFMLNGSQVLGWVDLDKTRSSERPEARNVCAAEGIAQTR